MNINILLQQNAPAVGLLLRRYRVQGNPASIETINAAHRQHGAAFLTELMAILTPTASFTGIGGVIAPGGIASQVAPVTAGKNKFWNFWDNLLNRVDSTGKAIGQFKLDASGNMVLIDEAAASQQRTQTMVLIIAGVIVLAIVAVLIFKKKS